jgi:hypothetical protein
VEPLASKELVAQVVLVVQVTLVERPLEPPALLLVFLVLVLVAVAVVVILAELLALLLVFLVVLVLVVLVLAELLVPALPLELERLDLLVRIHQSNSSSFY